MLQNGDVFPPLPLSAAVAAKFICLVIWPVASVWSCSTAVPGVHTAMPSLPRFRERRTGSPKRASEVSRYRWRIGRRRRHSSKITSSVSRSATAPMHERFPQPRAPSSTTIPPISRQPASSSIPKAAFKRPSTRLAPSVACCLTKIWGSSATSNHQKRGEDQRHKNKRARVGAALEIETTMGPVGSPRNEHKSNFPVNLKECDHGCVQEYRRGDRKAFHRGISGAAEERDRASRDRCLSSQQKAVYLCRYRLGGAPV